ncbi:MaoC/PaaZ C-terminal domain-containing protein [Nocardioides sp. AE5]|uniref:MaoC/PaaZ C-terminal domain-containing protein n=1 Tax=Nocardioides sp. AE5 TaxID=2962573 RepID=UPI0028821117|nr:MaoC/PaaZ C-terminal domain-containing protein [Nocardioides sp. AE5]MDT0203173.1 MaoC/PaaZ C-terminal domain-containing protein [Nocardioides sp. AE5]
MSTQWEVGTKHTGTLVEGLTRSQIVQYAGASGDFNPIHTDEVYAREAAGLPSVFGHGMLTMGLCGSFLQSLVGPPALRTYRARFVEKVWPGDSLKAVATVLERRESELGLEVHLDLAVTNQDESVVLTGSATALFVPTPSSTESNTDRSELPHA